MKSIKLIVFLALVVCIAVVFLPGCKKAAEMIPTAAVDAFSALKGKFVQEVQGKLDDYQAKIDELSKKAQAMPSPAKEEAIKKIDMVKAKLTEAKNKLDELNTATTETWDKSMSDMQVIVKDLGTLYEQALAAVK